MTLKPSALNDEQLYRLHLAKRQTQARWWRLFFLMAVALGTGMLIILLISVVNDTVGLVAVTEDVPVTTLSDRPLTELDSVTLATILKDNLKKGRFQLLTLQQLVGENFDKTKLKNASLVEFFPANVQIGTLDGTQSFLSLSVDDLATLLATNMSKENLVALINKEIVSYKVLEAWPLFASLFNRAAIDQEMKSKAAGEGFSATIGAEEKQKLAAEYAAAHLETRSWLQSEFLTTSSGSTAAESGIRGAMSGTFLVLTVAIGLAFPLGVGAAIYLEEYAQFTTNKWMRRFNGFISLNIRNLAGVPSIIYGLLGLAIFARILEVITSGRFLEGAGIEASPNGRTVLSAGLTLGILVLPVIIINAQEALRAVPRSIREASFGLGATRWQTIWRTALPSAIPGIMTGMILAVSRAIGETAPLVVIGAAVFLSKDPNNLFASFTTLPIQIYNWVAQPDDQYRSAASAGIIVLLVLLLALNAVAIIIRQQFSRKLQA